MCDSNPITRVIAAILTGTLASDAEQSLEAMRTSTVGPVTVSIGYADHVVTCEATETVERADVALLSAKAAGRDRVGNARDLRDPPGGQLESDGGHPVLVGRSLLGADATDALAEEEVDAGSHPVNRLDEGRTRHVLQHSRTNIVRVGPLR